MFWQLRMDYSYVMQLWTFRLGHSDKEYILYSYTTYALFLYIAHLLFWCHSLINALVGPAWCMTNTYLTGDSDSANSPWTSCASLESASLKKNKTNDYYNACVSKTVYTDKLSHGRLVNAAQSEMSTICILSGSAITNLHNLKWHGL
jgi:hypothetical protein